jgi:hypothetical protein
MMFLGLLKALPGDGTYSAAIPEQHGQPPFRMSNTWNFMSCGNRRCNAAAFRAEH